MAPVNWRQFVTGNLAAKILSLVMAAIFWLTVTVEKETVKSYTVPVTVANIPPGLTVGRSLPRNINVTVSGPAILFLAHPFPWKPVILDLRKTAKGTVEFPDLGKLIQIPDGFSVVRVYPASMDLRLVEE